jgi:carbon storage regulator
MLVLTRKVGEKIRIGSDVVVTLVRIQGEKVRIGIEAPIEVVIHREEVHRRLQAANGQTPLDPEGRPRVVRERGR